MSTVNAYTPGPANLAHVEKDGDAWTLVVVKDLRHSPENVWAAITDPAQLREWAPFDVDGSLDKLGATVNLSWVGAPKEHADAATVKQSDPPKLLVFHCGHGDVRWELVPVGQGTRLTLSINIPKAYIAMGAAGWQVCFDVMDHLLDGNPITRLAGPAAMQNPDWQRLHKEYAEQFGIEMPKW